MKLAIKVRHAAKMGNELEKCNRSRNLRVWGTQKKKSWHFLVKNPRDQNENLAAKKKREEKKIRYNQSSWCVVQFMTQLLLHTAAAAAAAAIGEP